MGEYVVVQVLTDGQWLDYARATAAQTLHMFKSRKVQAARHTWRAKHWISGNVLETPQLQCMSLEPDRFEDREPREWWRVTMHFEGEPDQADPTETTFFGVLYLVKEAVQVCQALGRMNQRGDIARIEIVSEVAEA